MFHAHHLLFLPFFVMFHIVGVLVLFLVGAFVLRAFRRRAHACGSAERSPRNRAFDDYRQATLRRLEQEADDFRKYLDGLRRAADAAAFDSFLKSRRADSGPAA
jgi:uncharacterized membrane protein